MTADAHREVRELLGSYAVGALAEEDAARVLSHLDGCAECREFLAELQPVALALKAADPAQVAAESPAPPPVEPLLAHISGTLARRRRRRFAAVGTAAVAVAASVLLALVTLDGGPAGPLPEERALRGTTAGVTGRITLLDRFWGTQLTLEAKGLPEREPVVIWIQRRGGGRVPAGTLLGLGDATIRAQLGASVRVRDAVSVGVSDDDGTVLLSSRLPG